MNECIEARKDSLQKLRRTFQPTPVFVGDDTHWSAYYVALNDQLFVASSPSEAIELSFHILFAVDAEYSTESRFVWQLLQNCIYDIQLDKDKKGVTVSKILGKLQ